MRGLLLGISLLALAAPVVHAQQSGVDRGDVAEAGEVEPGTYLVFFEFDRASLTQDARQTIAEAAEQYRSTGAARIALTGHTDRAGSDAYNRRLSERRVAAVRGELVRLGIPENTIASSTQGETDPLVQTADGVPEARNRRVEIFVPQPEAPAVAEPEPAVAAPAPVPAPMETTPPRMVEQEPRQERFVLSLAPIYGHNFRETDNNSKDSDLAGAELTFNLLPGFLGGVSLKQGVFWSFNAEDDGLAGRSVLSLDLAPDLGFVRPRLSANFGGVYGNGVQDGLVAGPELALDINLPGGITLRPKVAYDYQFRNPWDDWNDWDNGILWTGLDLGVRF